MRDIGLPFDRPADAPVFDGPKRKPSLADRLAAYFEAHRGYWLDGRQLAQIAGSYAWRTRCSDLRRAPYSMVIENRVRRLPGSGVKVSEYRWSGPAELATGGNDENRMPGTVGGI